MITECRMSRMQTLYAQSNSFQFGDKQPEMTLRNFKC